MSLPLPQQKHYDFILAGGGLAGLSAATELVRHEVFRQKSILIIDKAAKQGNDRTWCFWEHASECNAALTLPKARRWNKMLFASPGAGTMQLQTPDYQYVMLRSSDFYAWCYEQLAPYSNVHRLQAEIEKIDAVTGHVITDAGTYQGTWVLNSAVMPFHFASVNGARVGWEQVFAEGENTLINTGKAKTQAGVSRLQQHFLGWFIRTDEAVFDTDQIRLMDYHTPHEGDTRFVYVLPLSANEALVEYTVFSADVLESRAAYEHALREYLAAQLKISQFEIVETEFGVIPMSDFRASDTPVGRLVHIGTVGGTVKASSGYGYKNTRTRIRRFVADWAETGKPHVGLLQSGAKYRLYDGALLRVLEKQWLSGDQVFSALFTKLPAPIIFRFLDEKSTIREDFRIMLSVPTWPFLKAVWQKLWRRG